MRNKYIITFIVAFCVSIGCFSQSVQRQTQLSETADTSIVHTVRHYGYNYNFVVKADSLYLLRQKPDVDYEVLAADSFAIGKGERVVVAEIYEMAGDSTSTVWIQLASEQSEFGWVQEDKMLGMVVPDDPISQFISMFSDSYMTYFILIVAFICCLYIVQRLFKHHTMLVHVNDIPSLYPTLLALTIACSAVFYVSIRKFAPDIWEHFYYYPTLNPFSVRFPLCVFIGLIWLLLLLGLAVLDEVRKYLVFGDAITYLGGLLAVCAINYIVFTIATYYYIGYLLLPVYAVFAFWRYYNNGFAKWMCGNCGMKLKQKGRCPRCGAVNK